MTAWTRRARCGALLVLLCAGPLPAQTHEPDLVAPRPLTQAAPPAPVDAGGLPVEGWVTVRYSVLKDGTTANIRAVNRMPPAIDPAVALQIVGQWSFEPGTRDGAAIDWHNNESVVTFRLPIDAAEGAEAFEADYAAISAMLDAQPLGNTEALAASEALLNRQRSRLPALGLALVQSAVIHLGLEDLHSALERLRLATDPRVPTLSGTELFPALQLKMQIEDRLGRFRDVRATHERLLAGLGAGNADPAFIAFGEQLDARIATDEFLESKARIDGGSWRIEPLRRQFYIDQIQGTVRSIDAECDTRRIERPFNADDNYVLPASLGNCTVFIHGEPGTTFAFVEVLSSGE